MTCYVPLDSRSWALAELFSVPSMRKDGTHVSVACSIATLRDAAGAVTAIPALLRDMSERFEQDRARRTRVAQLEAPLCPAGLPTNEA